MLENFLTVFLKKCCLFTFFSILNCHLNVFYVYVVTGRVCDL